MTTTLTFVIGSLGGSSRRTAWLAAVLILGAQVVHAHHSFATHYKYDEHVEISGVITEFRLANTHSFMHIEVALESGATETWEVEANSVVLLRRAISRTRRFVLAIGCA